MFNLTGVLLVITNKAKELRPLRQNLGVKDQDVAKSEQGYELKDPMPPEEYYLRPATDFSPVNI